MKSMKKLLACSVAALIAASMMTACGDTDDDSSSATETTTTTAAAEEEAEAEEESEAEEEESEAEEEAESEAEEETESTEETEEETESTEDADSEEEAEGPVDISEMPATLQSLATASLTFTTDMDPADFVKTMCEQNFENDESDCEFSIEEVEGVPMLRVQVLDLKDESDPSLGYKIPKIQFDLSKIFEGKTDTLDDVFTIEMEVMTKAVGMFTADDGTESLVPGNFMGALCTQPGSDPDNLAWKELESVSESEWVSEWATYNLTCRPGVMGPLEAVDTTQYFTFMRWSIPNQADFYIVDITFKDEDGNVLPVSIGGHAE